MKKRKKSEEISREFELSRQKEIGRIRNSNGGNPPDPDPPNPPEPPEEENPDDPNQPGGSA